MPQTLANQGFAQIVKNQYTENPDTKSNSLYNQQSLKSINPIIDLSEFMFAASIPLFVIPL